MLHLDYRDARPIYEQVKDGLRRLMVAGIMQEGEKLPSVRAMASNLAINPNTIQKAYEALESEGYVYSIPGKGSFVAPHTEVDEKRKQQLASIHFQSARLMTEFNDRLLAIEQRTRNKNLKHGKIKSRLPT